VVLQARGSSLRKRNPHVASCATVLAAPLVYRGFRNEVQIMVSSSPPTKNQRGRHSDGQWRQRRISRFRTFLWNGPIGAVRVAEIDGQFVAIHPSSRCSLHARFSSTGQRTKKKNMLMIEVQPTNHEERSSKPCFRPHFRFAPSSRRSKKSLTIAG